LRAQSPASARSAMRLTSGNPPWGRGGRARRALCSLTATGEPSRRARDLVARRRARRHPPAACERKSYARSSHTPSNP
jgi:hypothetical protein